MDELPDDSRIARIRQQLEQTVAGNPMDLFAVIDGARIHALRTLLMMLDVPAQSLFSEHGESTIAHAGPYLAQPKLDDVFFAWLRQDARALPSMVFIASSAYSSEVRKHLRRFLLVLDTRRKGVYFRFYDPRVLKPFLANCDDAEKTDFFGPIRLMLAADPDEPPDRDASRPSSAPLLRFPAPLNLNTAQAASPRQRFQLRPQHHDAFARVCREDYEKRVEAYLRARHPDRLAGAPSETVRGYISRASALAGALWIHAGRDVTLLADVLVENDEPAVRMQLMRVPPNMRPKLLQEMVHQMATGGAR